MIKIVGTDHHKGVTVVAKAKIKAVPKRRKPKNRPRKKGISLTELAVKQIELMLVAVYRDQGKRIPNQEVLRRRALKYYKDHFD